MKKILLLLVAAFSVYQINAQCTTAVTASPLGNSISATAIATGGTAPYFYSYTLNPGNITNTFGVFSGLANGSYTVCATATDNLNNTCSIGCDTVVVNNPSSGCSTSLAAIGTTSSINALAVGSFGTAPYTYSYTLNPGNVTNTSGVFIGVSFGLYNVCAMATDSLNQTCSIQCTTVSAGVSFVCNTTLSLSSSGSTVNASANSTGGNAPYTHSYTLNPGNLTNSTGVFTGLADGQYIVCVTSSDFTNNLCSSDCDTISVNSSSSCTTTINSSSSGNSISAIATATGGNPPYTFSYTLNPGNITNTTGVFSGLADGGYSVCATATDVQNITCSIACDSAVVNNTNPTGCVITANFTEVISGNNVSFTNNSTITNGTISNNSWAFGDGNFSTAASPNHMYATSNTYNVLLVVNGVDANQNPCIDSFSKSITVGPSNVNDHAVNTLTLYPNPTAQEFRIELPTNEQFKNLIITDVFGRVVNADFDASNSLVLNVSLGNNAAGIYFIKLQTDRNRYTSRIMKQK